MVTQQNLHYRNIFGQQASDVVAEIKAVTKSLVYFKATGTAGAPHTIFQPTEIKSMLTSAVPSRDAIVEPYLLDARRCISYLTIELRGAIPEEFRPGMGRMIFGCDICQDVCPWNRNAPVTNLAEFMPRRIAAKSDGGTSAQPPGGAGNETETLFAPLLESLASLSEQEFREIFRGGPIKRTKWRGLIRNVCVALGNSPQAHGSGQHSRIIALLKSLGASSDAIIAEHARWALARLSRSD